MKGRLCDFHLDQWRGLCSFILRDRGSCKNENVDLFYCVPRVVSLIIMFFLNNSVRVLSKKGLKLPKIKGNTDRTRAAFCPRDRGDRTSKRNTLACLKVTTYL